MPSAKVLPPAKVAPPSRAPPPAKESARRSSDAAAAPPEKRERKKSTWGGGDRFEPRVGWTSEKGRDEERFRQLTGGAMEVGGDAASSSGSRFVVSRPEEKLVCARSPPGTVCPEMCTAEGAGLSQAILKTPSLFRIEPRDSEGRPVVASVADVFRIHIKGLETPKHAVVEEEDGVLTVRWLPCVSGDFKLSVTVNGTHIQSSPFKAGAAKGTIDARTSCVVDMPREVGVGQPARFAVEARDQMAHLADYPPLSQAKYSFAVRVEGPLSEADGGWPAVAGAEPHPRSADEPAPAQLGTLSNGLQKVSVLLAIVGRYRLSVLGEDGTLVSGRSFLLEVLPTFVHAKFCQLSGAGLSTALAGKGGEFDCHAVDRHGNACGLAPEWAADPKFGFEVTLKFLGDKQGGGSSNRPSSAARARDEAIEQWKKRRKIPQSAEVQGAVERRGMGQFKCTYSTTSAGEYELAVKHAGIPLSSSPHALSVAPGPTSARACVRLLQVDEAEPLKPAAAGRRNSFVLLARDHFGNVRHEGGDKIRAGLLGPEKLDLEVADCGDGTYEIFYQPQTAGEYMLAVTLRAEPVLGSPFALRVLTAETHGPSCVASGQHLELGDVAETHSVMVEARDVNGNPRGIGGDLVTAWVIGPAPRQTVAQSDPGANANAPLTNQRVDCTVRDCDDGWYEVSYEIHTIGRYKLHIAVNEDPLEESPFNLTITGGRTHPPACIRIGALPTDRNLPAGGAGVDYDFAIEARDDFDKPRGFGGDEFVCTITGGSAGEKTHGTVLDHGDGTYQISFVPASAGAYLVGVTLKNEHIAGSRFALEVKPSSAHAPSCVGSGAGLRVADAGSRARFAVQTWDAFGNVAGPPLSSLKVRLVCDDSPIIVVPRGIEIANGRYAFTYTAQVAGEYKMHVLVATKQEKREGTFAGAKSTRFEPMHIAGSPFTVRVKPGPTYPPACGVRWDSPQSLTVGTPVRLVIESRDRFFNARDEAGDKYTIKLSPKTTVEGGRTIDLVARDGWRPVDVPPPPVICVGKVEESEEGPGLYEATVTANLAGEYKVILGMEAQEAEGDGEASEGGKSGSAQQEAAEPQLSAEEQAMKEAELLAEAEADAEAEAIARAAAGLPPAPKLSFGTLATLISRINAWRVRGAAAAAERRKRLGSRTQIYTADVHYEPEVTCPETCVVSGAGLLNSTEGLPVAWTIQPRDRFSNATNEPYHSFVVAITRPGSAERLDMDGLASIAQYDGPHNATVVSWLWSTSGSFLVHVSLKGTPLAGSPFALQVSPTYRDEPLGTPHPGLVRKVTLNNLGEIVRGGAHNCRARLAADVSPRLDRAVKESRG